MLVKFISYYNRLSSLIKLINKLTIKLSINNNILHECIFSNNLKNSYNDSRENFLNLFSFFIIIFFFFVIRSP